MDLSSSNGEQALLLRMLPRERLYVESAVGLVYDIRFFNEDNISIACKSTARKMQSEEGEKIRIWETQLKTTTCDQIKKYRMTNMTEEANKPGPSISFKPSMFKPLLPSVSGWLKPLQKILSHTRLSQPVEVG